MIRDYQLTLAAAAKRLSDVYTGGATAANDIPYRQVLLQAEGADAFIGGSDAVTASAYGTKVDSTELLPVVLGPFDQGPIKLSDLWAAGAGATLHITGIPF